MFVLDGGWFIKVFSLLDAYRKMNRPLCIQWLRNNNEMNAPRVFDIHHAKEECSRRPRCIGLDIKDGRPEVQLCVDSVYRSTGLRKYGYKDTYVASKLENYGKCLF